VRFIDLEDLLPGIGEFVAGLADARDRVLAEPDPARRTVLINDLRDRWVAFRPALSGLSHGKCWYTETRNIGTDDDVDHFRPKLRVAEDPDHPGYYWLAFDWRNFRFSSHRANRLRVNPVTLQTGGKGDHFPLINPASRAMLPTDNLGLEQPALLDPCSPVDPAILWFKSNGEADISPAFMENPAAEAKFEASRLILHFNWPEFVDARLQLYNRIVRHVERGALTAPQLDSGFAPTEAFVNAIRDLIRALQPDAEFSAAARSYVESFKDLWWIQEIVLRAA
jgi:hypothetical protein